MIYEGQPGVDHRRSPGSVWSIRPGNSLSPSLEAHWNAMRGQVPQGYVVYLGEAMRREATAGEA